MKEQSNKESGYILFT